MRKILVFLVQDIKKWDVEEPINKLMKVKDGRITYICRLYRLYIGSTWADEGKGEEVKVSE